MTDKSEARELSLSELDAVIGGNILGDIVRGVEAVIRIFTGSGPQTNK